MAFISSSKIILEYRHVLETLDNLSIFKNLRKQLAWSPKVGDTQLKHRCTNYSLPSPFTSFPRHHSYLTLLLPHLTDVFTTKHSGVQSLEFSLYICSPDGLQSYALNMIHMLLMPKFIQAFQISPLKWQTQIINCLLDIYISQRHLKIYMSEVELMFPLQ